MKHPRLWISILMTLLTVSLSGVVVTDNAFAADKRPTTKSSAVDLEKAKQDLDASIAALNDSKRGAGDRADASPELISLKSNMDEKLESLRNARAGSDAQEKIIASGEFSRAKNAYLKKRESLIADDDE